MGHLQEMNDKQRSEFQSYQYKRMLEERRGHNYKYHSDELEESLKEKSKVLFGRLQEKSLNIAIYIAM